MNVLFLCTGNSCRSLISEAVFNHLALAQPAGRDAVRGCRLYHGRLLVHGVDFVRQPAVTLARSATNTFAGIRPADTPAFIAAQLLGAAAATLLFCWLYPAPHRDATVAGTVARSDFSNSQGHQETRHG